MIFNGFALRIVLAAAALLAAVVFGYSAGGASARRDYAEREAWIAAQFAADMAAARDQESSWRKKVDEVNNDREKERVKNERIAAGLRADNDRMRVAISSYATGGGDDSLAACRDRAGTIGKLLDQALRTGAECAGGAETATGDLRRVLAAWPVNGAASGPPQ